MAYDWLTGIIQGGAKCGDEYLPGEDYIGGCWVERMTDFVFSQYL